MPNPQTLHLSKLHIDAILELNFLHSKNLQWVKIVKSPKGFVLNMPNCITMKKPKTGTSDIQLILT